MIPSSSTLENLCEFIVDCPHSTAPTQATGIPQIRTTNIRNGRLDLVNAQKVSDVTYEEWIARAEPEAGDLILAREAPVGQVGMVPRGVKVCLGQRTVLIRPDSTRIHPRFLLYLLLSPALQSEMQSRAAGSTTPHLNVVDIKQLETPILPDRSRQAEVAGILGALDDKVELNWHNTDTLDQISRALFKCWFVDFEPVLERSAVPKNIRDLFPDRLVESPIGLVPEGWEVANVGALVSVSRETIDPREHPEEQFDHFSFPAFDAGQAPSIDVGATIKSVKLHVPDGSVFISKLNPRIPRIWWPQPADSRRRVASTEFVISLPRVPITRTYLYGLFTSSPFQTALLSLVRGTSGSHQRVSIDDLLRIPVVAPPAEVVAHFDALNSPIFKLKASLQIESQLLTELRDTLLPRLVSGANQLPR